jgi:hypothetical protein
MNPATLFISYSHRDERLVTDLIRANQALVIPAILRAVDWEDSPFGALQALPKNAKPVAEWRDRHQAFREVVRGIREALSREAYGIERNPCGSCAVRGAILPEPHVLLETGKAE